jgi:membrane fusion protein YbhG
MAHWSRPIVIAALVVVLGLATVYAARRFGGGGAPIQVTGTIEALQVDVSAKIGGRISQLLVTDGSPVTAGQVVAVLDTTDLAAEQRRAEAAVVTAEAQLRDLVAGARVWEVNGARAEVERAAARLDDLLAGSRAQEIQQARAAVVSAAATREWTERDYERVKALYAKDLVSAQDVDRAKQAWEVAAATERSAREKASLVEEGARAHEVAAARAELRAARERLALLLAGPRPEAVAAARAQVQEARAALALAETRLHEGTIVSPLSGFVLRKNLEAGEMANPGVSIVTLVDPQNMWLRAYVPEADVGRIRLGEAAQITVDAFPARGFPGRISEIAPGAEFTPKNVQTVKERTNLVFRIKIALPNADGVLKPGMPADATLGAGG